MLFHWRNLRDPTLRAASFGALAAAVLFEGRPEKRRGLAEAVTRFSQARARREPGLGDQAILRRVADR